ncbi:hypothetical protein TWF192_004711 [Orbilia oligospora]|uniref:ribonuclease H n=1 Tax=Orbilia oligospora TaxID=2813651 RepID=A0A6G1MAD7_ORBOL|nr:hypothetical protein TWF191_008523 [Orbilia oligospora]KAF3251751.1 hypothetical protein TWF192_004711 [Orbilia oligospora]
MAYTMKFKVDGACRGNGRPGSIAVAAACLYRKKGSYTARVEYLADDDIVPTNQRAEISAIIIALEWVLDKYPELRGTPYMDATIMSDSRYAVNSMTEWVNKWKDNGWYNAARRPVANTDLFQRALALQDEISCIGEVNYEWISREENLDADRACKEALDSTY